MERNRLSIDGIVSLSNSHPSAEKSFLFDFPLKFCAAGPLQTHCSFFWPNPEAVLCSLHAFKIDLVGHIMWKPSIPAGCPVFDGFIVANAE